MRFDLMVLAYLQIPVSLAILLVSLWGGPPHIARLWRWSRSYLLVGFCILLLIAGGDQAYFAYFRDHFTVFALSIFEDHTVGVLDMIWGMYPIVWMTLGALTLFTIVAWMGVKTAPALSNSLHWPRRPAFLGGALLCVVVTALFARGSVGKFPLRARMAAVSESTLINQAVLNGPFALKEALSARSQSTGPSTLGEDLGFPTAGDAFATLQRNDLPIHDLPSALQALDRPGTDEGTESRPHVLVLVMESLGSHVLPYQSEDFDLLGPLAKHLKNGIEFQRSIPSTNSTIGTVSSLASGLPHLPGRPYLAQSRQNQVPLPTAPAKWFASLGYETRFLYGGNSTWRKLNTWLPRQGFQNTEGRMHIRQALQLTDEHEAHWKVFDEYLLEHLRQGLLESNAPRYELLLSVTNHPPFDIPGADLLPPLQPPKELSDRFMNPDVAKKRLQGIQYSLHALGDFLNILEQDGVLENTLVVITGDHNTMDLTPFQQEQALDRFGVPLWILGPNKVVGKLRPYTQRPISHLQLLPSLLRAISPNLSFTSLIPPIQDDSFPAVNVDGLVLDDARAWTTGVLERQSFSWHSEQSRTLVPLAQPDAKGEALLTRSNALLATTDYLLRFLTP